MSYSNKPENMNFLQPTKYILTFSDVPDTVYFCQKVTVPGLSIGSVTQSTPNLEFFLPGTKITFDDFEIEFLVNEDMASWLSLYNWMKNITTDIVKTKRSEGEAVLSILSNQNNPKLRILFKNIFPYTLGGFEMNTTLSAEDHMVATATFKYSYFTVEKL